MALRQSASATSLTLLNRRMLRAKLRRMDRMVGLLRTRLASSCMETSSMSWTRFSPPVAARRGSVMLGAGALAGRCPPCDIVRAAPFPADGDLLGLNRAGGAD